MTTTPHCQNTCVDVAILGGGLAGLSLAIQLKLRDPAINITVIERHAHPVPEAAFKVGESTVEIGAHYFANVLGLRDHLEQAHIRKFGFRFFFSDRYTSIDKVTEMGVSKVLPTPSWQIDRGRFENFLGSRAKELGVDFVDNASVTQLQLQQDNQPHQISYIANNSSHSLTARWLIDASGRAGLIKRKLDLTKPNSHDANAVWWRVDGLIDINQWSASKAWLARCTPPDRWRSTNHLCGPGYWVWLIPLSSGAHSVGIVCDSSMHRLESMNTHEKAMQWLAAHQPQLAKALQNPQHGIQDFRFFRNFSYDCKQVFSANRWALTGEAGLFLDPFYSPGSDYIAIANMMIGDMIDKDRNGKPFAPYADVYQQMYTSFYENTLTLYQDQYALFGDADIMPLKVVWDYTYYWALLAPLAVSDRLTNLRLMGRLKPFFESTRLLNLAMQPMLREWSQRNGDNNPPKTHRMLDQYHIDWFLELNSALHDTCEDTTFEKRIASNVERMHQLAAEYLLHAKAAYPDINDYGLSALIPTIANNTPLLTPIWYAHSAMLQMTGEALAT